MADWHVGQRVVCVSNKSFRGPEDGEIWPKIGELYTIRDIELEVNIPFKGKLTCFRLQEIRNPILVYLVDYSLRKMEVAFDSDWFRPLDETEVDISIFTKILDDVNKGKVLDKEVVMQRELDEFLRSAIWGD